MKNTEKKKEKKNYYLKKFAQRIRGIGTEWVSTKRTVQEEIVRGTVWKGRQVRGSTSNEIHEQNITRCNGG